MGSVSVFRTLGFILASQLFIASALAQGSQSAQSNQARDGSTASEDIRFEVASIHPLKGAPSSFSWAPTPTGFDSGLNVYMYVKLAYAPERPSISMIGPGGVLQVQKLPNWAVDWYQINARVSEADLAAWQSQGSECKLLKAALRNLLKDRFQLVVHEEKTEVPVYNLVVGKKGPKLKASALTSEPAHDSANGMRLASGGTMAANPRNDGRTEWHFAFATMDDLAEFLGRMQLPVHNMTNLTGRYDFVLLMVDRDSWDRENPLNNWPIDALGLELKAGKATGINLIVDHIEKPSEN